MPLGPFTEAASAEKKSHAAKIWKLGPEDKFAILTLQGRVASREGGSGNTCEQGKEKGDGEEERGLKCGSEK